MSMYMAKAKDKSCGEIRSVLWTAAYRTVRTVVLGYYANANIYVRF